MQLASESQGCSVVSATSNDLVHLPSSILANERSGDSNDNFWMSTGSFPQEIVIQLGAASSIRSVDIVSLGIRKIQVDKCDGPQANRLMKNELLLSWLNVSFTLPLPSTVCGAYHSWETVCAQEANDADGDLQRLSMNIPPRLTASYLRFKVGRTIISKYVSSVLSLHFIRSM